MKYSPRSALIPLTSPRTTLSRRSLLKVGAIAGISWRTLARHAHAEPTRGVGLYLPGQVTASPELATPTGKQVPFGWRAATIAPRETGPLEIGFPDLPRDDPPIRLRFSMAIEMREKTLVTATLPKSGRSVGTFDVRFVPPFQPHEIKLTPEDGAAIRTEGVQLTLTEGENPLWVFVSGGEGPAIDPALLPHLLFCSECDSYTEYFHRLASVASVQGFGWMEGCVLDGLLDLGELPNQRRMRTTALTHLNLFLDGDRLLYEDPHSRPVDNRVYGIEGTLPFAAIARVYPNHPTLDLAVGFWKQRQDDAGAVIDGQTTTSEGAYTVGYPLARIAKARQSDELAAMALTQLRVRQQRLFTGEKFDRTYTPGGRQGHSAWCRGIAWELIGMARTMRVLKDHPRTKQLVPSFAKLAAWAMKHQREDGLWAVFVKRPKLTQDTAGSSGIAAALAIGHQQGWLDNSARQAAERTLSGLKPHLTPDGFLGGAAQSNKGGESLQSGNYRVIYQMAMGLMGQLIAALDV